MQLRHCLTHFYLKNVGGSLRNCAIGPAATGCFKTSTTDYQLWGRGYVSHSGSAACPTGGGFAMCLLPKWMSISKAIWNSYSIHCIEKQVVPYKWKHFLICFPKCFTYSRGHSPTLLLLLLRHNSFSNPSVASPRSSGGCPYSAIAQ